MMPTTLPWYREKLVWLLIAPPVAAVAVGMTLLYLSIATRDGLVVDDYYRQGKAINQVLKRDDAARTYAEHGELVLTDHEAVLSLKGRAVALPTLQLKFLHATRDVHDVAITLTHDHDEVFHATLPPLPAGRYYVQLEGADWRLLGSMVLPHDRHLALSAQ